MSVAHQRPVNRKQHEGHAYNVCTQDNVIRPCFTLLFHPAPSQAMAPSQNTCVDILVVQFVEEEVLLERFDDAFITVGSGEMLSFEVFGTKNGDKAGACPELKHILAGD